MRFILLLVISAIVSGLQAQYSEMGITGGLCNYVGDLQNRLQSGTYRPGGGLIYTYNPSKRYFFRGVASGGSFEGSDENSRNYLTRLRNLSVRTNFYDVSVQAGFNLVPYDIRDRKIASPYLYAGIGGMYFDPRAQLNGKWYRLQRLGTEGQYLDNPIKKPYSLLTLMVPVGGGFRFALTERFNLGIDMGVRFTLTDYLDDISGLYPDINKLTAQNADAGILSYRTVELFPDQELDNPMGQPRGDNYKTDRYFYGGVTLTYNLASGYDLEFDPRFKIFRDGYLPDSTANAPKPEVASPSPAPSADATNTAPAKKEEKPKRREKKAKADKAAPADDKVQKDKGKKGEAVIENFQPQHIN